jgi:hypothetical protein
VLINIAWWMPGIPDVPIIFTAATRDFTPVWTLGITFGCEIQD